MRIIVAVREYFSARRPSAALLLLNTVAAAAYVYAAIPSWVIPVERAHGVYSITGEPYIWFGRAVPILALSFLIDVIWGVRLCIRRNWRSGVLWVASVTIWLGALWIDFSHH